MYNWGPLFTHLITCHEGNKSFNKRERYAAIETEKFYGLTCFKNIKQKKSKKNRGICKAKTRKKTEASG